jgi:colanic acid/amylovoran biosynthesis glycosyltransferase
MNELRLSASAGNELPLVRQAGDAGPIARVAPPAITYFSLSFPELTQTFVFNEMRHLKALGADIDVVALRPPRNEMSDLPQLYGFGERIVYADPGLAVRNRMQRIQLAAESVLRLAASGRASGAWRLARSATESGSLNRSMSLHLAARFKHGGSAENIVLCHFGPAGRVAARLKASGLLKGRLVTVFHGYDVTQYLDDNPPEIYRELFAQADLLITISDRWRGRLLELGAPSEKVETIRLGIDCAAFEYKPRCLAPGGPVRLISVGRLTEKKGHRFTIDALAQLAARRPDIDFRLDLVGSGPGLEQLRTQIASLGLNSRVRLLGGINHDQVRALLDDAHIFVLHSVTAADGDMEGIPVSIMEAMAMGLPVVSTRHSGIPELVADGRSGFLVEERDATAFAERLEQLIKDPALIGSMGRAGRTIIEADYNADRQAARLLGRLGKLVSADLSGAE